MKRISNTEKESGMKMSEAKLKRRLEYLNQNGFKVEDKRKPIKEKTMTSVVVQGAMEEGLDEKQAKEYAEDYHATDKTLKAPETKTTRDYILEALDGPVAKGVDSLYTEINGYYPVTRKAVQSCLKRLVEGGLVEKHEDTSCFVKVSK